MKTRYNQGLSTGFFSDLCVCKSSAIMSMILAVLILSVTSTTPTVTAAAAEPPVSWTVYHSWNPQQKFVKRGTITWNKEESSKEEEEQAPSKSKAHDALLEVINDKALSAKDVADMLDYGWYHVKLVPSSSKNSDSDAVLGTVPACHVRRSNFKDLFELTLPRSVADASAQDAVTSFAYTPLISPLAPKTCDDYPEFNKEEVAFTSRTNVVLDTPGLPLKPILSTSKPPPGLKFLKRPKTAGDANAANKGAGEASEGGYEDPNENANKQEPPSGPFGFIQKYWYVILPMVLMQFMAPPPEEGQQQQQGQDGAQGDGQQQQGGGQVAAAAPSPGGSGKKGRRGKR
ncbi:MAG: hypothetical protein SGILL_003323, partial [Bacillariaceae sp.]